MNHSFKKSLLYSSILHSLPIILFLLLSGGGGNGENRGRDRTQSGNIIAPKEDGYEIDVIPVGNTKKKKSHKKKKKAQDCTMYYGGIGVTLSLVTGHVTEALPEYPGYRNGIRVDDVILNQESLIGTIGEAVEVHYLHQGEEHVVTIIREKICTDKIGVHP